MPRIGLPQARPLMVWLTTAWKMEADRSSLVAPSLMRGWISDLGENAAAGRDRIDCLVIFRVLIQTGCVRLKQRSHLINKRAGASGADSVHTLVDAAGKVNDFRIFAAKLDGNVGLRGIILQGCGNRYNLLDKWNAQMFRKC